MKKLVYAILTALFITLTIAKPIMAYGSKPLTVIVHPSAIVTDYAIKQAIGEAEIFLGVDYTVAIQRPIVHKTFFSNVATVKRLKSNTILILPQSKMNRDVNGVSNGTRAIVTDSPSKFQITMMHELGHMNGLGHTLTGIMAEYMD